MFTDRDPDTNGGNNQVVVRLARRRLPAPVLLINRLVGHTLSLARPREDRSSMSATTTAPRRPRHELMPQPPAEDVRYPVISVDDHVVEPPDLFTSRLPAKLRDAAPRVVEDAGGDQYWQIGDQRFRVGIQGMSAVGLPPDKRTYDAIRYDEMWPGSVSFDARVRDMDRCGVAVSLCFPSTVFGFAGRRLADLPDRDLGLACFEAYNQWTDDYANDHPGRFVKQQIAWLHDVDVAVEQVRRNAARGFTALSWTENPERLGLPSLYSGYWDPLFAACQETETVVDLHVGSGALTMVPSTETPAPAHSVLFPANGIMAAVDWIFAGIPSRYPDLKIVFSEAGIGWAPMLLERMERQEARGRLNPDGWPAPEEGNMFTRPFEPLPEPMADAFRRNYYFATLGEPLLLRLRDAIGLDHIMMECDYPHTDALFPHVQDVVAASTAGCTEPEIHKITWANASRLYRHPLPEIPGFPAVP
jgi:predicted TIM-barrel fold metal-dependent hydrolase